MESQSIKFEQWSRSRKSKSQKNLTPELELRVGAKKITPELNSEVGVEKKAPETESEVAVELYELQNRGRESGSEK